MITILLFSYSTIVRVSNERQFATMVTMLVAGFGLLIALNVALVAVGMRGVEVSAEDGPNKILSLVGLNVQRIRSPLSGGLNNFAAISGLTFAMGLSLARVSRGFRRFLGIAVSLLGLVGLVLADSRAVIASSFLAIFVCVVLTRSASVRRLSPNAIYFLPFLPVLFVLVFPVLQESGALRWLQREGTFAAKIGVTSGRDIIWSAIVDVAKDWNPIQVVGYGAYGQVLSGAAKDYSWIFSELGSGSGKSTHNAALQIFIDLGYLGLAIWLIWLSRLIRMIVGQIEFGVGASGGAVRAGYLYPVLIGVVLILLCGLTEVSGTIYYPDIFSFLLISSIWLPGVCALRELTRNE
jgi:O-antigen ligase